MIPLGVLTSVRSSGIVTQGLVLNLDAADPLSYPGSGTIWYDLSDYGNNGTLVGNPTYSASNDGVLQFTTTQYTNFLAAGLTTTATIEMWCNPTILTEKMFFGFNKYDVYNKSTYGMGFNTGNSDVYGISVARVTELDLLNKWNHYVFEMRSDVHYSSNKIYINSQQETISRISSSEFASQRNFNNGIGRTGSWTTDTKHVMPMSLGCFRVYNRSLTQLEVTQNFNVTRARYGI